MDVSLDGEGSDLVNQDSVQKKFSQKDTIPDEGNIAYEIVVSPSNSSDSQTLNKQNTSD
ncbi:MAG: hypothetical protein GXP45_00795 [bacterium]|nr:hypothetical protein [bacterium]